MAKLKDDEIKWILSLDASQTQQEIHKVTQANKELVKSNKDLAKDMRALEAQGKKNGEEWNNLKASYDENTAAIAKNNTKLKEHEKTLGLEGMTMTQLKKRAKELQNQLDNTAQATSPEAYAKLDKELNQVTGRMKVLKTSGSGISDQLSAIPGPAGQAIGSLKGVGAALKALIANPVGIVIMAIVAAFYLLKTAIAGSDEASTKFEGVMNGLSVLFDTWKRAVTEYVGALINLVTLDFSGLKENINNMADLAKNTAANTKAAYEAAIAEDALNDAIAKNNDVSKVNSARISELRQISQDSTKSLKERQKASNEVLRLEKENYKMAVSNITGNYNMWIGKNKNLIDEMKKGSKAQMQEVEKYMKMVQNGTELTYNQRLALAQLVNNITSTLKSNDENLKEEFRGFFNELSGMQQEYFDGSKKDQKNASKLEEEARAEREAKAKEWIEKQITRNEQALQREINKLKKKRGEGLLTEIEYNNQVDIETKKSIENQLKIKGLSKDKILDLQSQLYDSQIKLKEKYEKLLADTSISISIETNSYNDRLKAAGLFGLELSSLTQDQLNQRLIIDTEFQKKLTEIALKGEDERFKNALAESGIDGDPAKLEGDKLKVYELLNQQHIFNNQKITDDGNKKAIDSKKATDNAILKLIQESGAANQKVIDTVEKSKISKLKSDLLYGLVTQEEYETELKQIESDSLAERLTAQEKYIAMLKNIANPTEEQQKELENAESVLTGIQTQIYDKKLADEKSFQDKRKALIQQYGLQSMFDTHALEMAELEKQHQQGLLSEEQFEQARLKLKIKAAQDYASQVQGIVSAGSQLVQSLQSAETSNIQADYAKRMSGLNQSDADYAAQKEQLQYEQAVAELDIQKKYANAQFGIQVAQIGVATATGIMNAWASSMVLGPIAGPIAAGALSLVIGATSAAQIVSANAERQKLLATTIESPSSGGGAAVVSGAVVSKSGYADGGYTGDGGKYDVAGYLPNGQPFHRGEYFVAQEEMRNPILIPLIRKIDSERSRRTGSTSLPGSFGSGYADGGYTGSGSASAESILMARTVEEFRAAVNYFAGIKFKAEINYWEWVDAQKTIEESQNLAKRAS